MEYDYKVLRKCTRKGYEGEEVLATVATFEDAMQIAHLLNNAGIIKHIEYVVKCMVPFPRELKAF